MKIAVAGKGGVGKTTISAGISLILAEAGEAVFAVDADPNNCLGYALGFPAETVEKLRPVSEMRELLAERSGTAAGGPVFALAPPVDDLIEEYRVTRGSLSFLVMGSIIQGGGGCACPENATLKALLREMVALPEHVIVDLEAGLEHLGRGTAGALDVLVAVTPPTPTGVRTTQRIARLAREVGLTDVRVVGNLVASEEEATFVRNEVGDLPVVGVLSRHPGLSSDGVLGGSAGEALRRDLGPIVEALR
jgi:CO dehydrogenase maturation factor